MFRCSRFPRIVVVVVVVVEFSELQNFRTARFWASEYGASFWQSRICGCPCTGMRPRFFWCPVSMHFGHFGVSMHWHAPTVLGPKLLPCTHAFRHVHVLATYTDQIKHNDDHAHKRIFATNQSSRSLSHCTWHCPTLFLL